MNAPLIICLMGPTASGKTDLALGLFEHFPCNLISVDSAMVYRGMNIGTAKPSADTLAAVPHQLIDICDPFEAYSAGRFCQDADASVKQSLAEGRVPVLVGGTMLYFRAFQQGLSPLPAANIEVRKMLMEEADQLGWETLYQRLVKIDPVAAERIDIHDQQRIQRALEIYELTGKAISEIHAREAVSVLPYRFLNIALIPSDRQILHDRIAIRFKEMLEHGLIEEVEQLYRRGDLAADMTSLRSVGYRQVWAYLEGKLSLIEMEEQAIAATRQLAKRQFTWLRSWKDIHYFDSDRADVFSKILDFIGSSQEK